MSVDSPICSPKRQQKGAQLVKIGQNCYKFANVFAIWIIKSEVRGEFASCHVFYTDQPLAAKDAFGTF